MTMAAHIADPHLLRTLTACLRRRVPSPDVEDVAQTVLCDALEARNAPTDPEELRRWVSGITRHKIADYHRRARRLVLREDAGEETASEDQNRVEARGVLADVADAAKGPREKETLGWLVREHAGEQLSEIAREEGLSGAVVRQRVSRFRRALRARFGAALTVALAIFAGSAMYASRTRETIVAEGGIQETRLALSAAEGRWYVAGVWATGPLSAAEKSLVEGELRGATIVIARDHVEVVTAAGRVERRDVRGSGGILVGTTGSATPVRASARLLENGQLADVRATAGRAHVQLQLVRLP